MAASCPLSITPYTFIDDKHTVTILNIKSNPHPIEPKFKPTTWIILLHIGNEMNSLSDDGTTKLSIAKHAIATIVDAANDGDAFILYTFHNELTSCIPITIINKKTRKNTNKILYKIKASAGNTWHTSMLWSKKIQKVIQSKYVRNTNVSILLFVSTNPYIALFPTWCDTSEYNDMKNLINKNITLHTFSLSNTTKYLSTILSLFSRIRYGVYINLPDMETVQKAFPPLIAHIKNTHIPHITLSFDTDAEVVGYVQKVSKHNWHICIGSIGYKQERNIVIRSSNPHYNIVALYGNNNMHTSISIIKCQDVDDTIKIHYYRCLIASTIHTSMILIGWYNAVKNDNSIEKAGVQTFIINQRRSFFKDVHNNLQKMYDHLITINNPRLSDLLNDLHSVLLSDKIFSTQFIFDRWGESYLRTMHITWRSEMCLGFSDGFMSSNPVDPPPYSSLCDDLVPLENHESSWVKIKKGFGGLFKW